MKKNFYYVVVNDAEKNDVVMYWTRSINSFFADMKLRKVIRSKHRKTGYEAPIRYSLFKYGTNESGLIYKDKQLW